MPRWKCRNPECKKAWQIKERISPKDKVECPYCHHKSEPWILWGWDADADG